MHTVDEQKLKSKPRRICNIQQVDHNYFKYKLIVHNHTITSKQSNDQINTNLWTVDWKPGWINVA